MPAAPAPSPSSSPSPSPSSSPGPSPSPAAAGSRDRSPTACVVGAGISGTACARALVAVGLQVRVLDRGRTPGGRMASRRLDGRPVDTGASYFVARDPAFRAVVSDWEARGLARPWTDRFHVSTPQGLQGPKEGPVRHGAPGGLRSLVEDLARDLDVVPETTVRGVGPGPVVDGQPYDAVVLAMPDPQALRLLDPALEQERAAIGGREWRPALSLAAGFAERGWDLDGAFVQDDPVLGWFADDGQRRGDGAAVLVAHSTSEFAGQHLADPQAGAAPMVAALRARLGVPEPAWTSLQRWTWSQPVGEREAPYFLGEAGVGLCGDGWGVSKVEAAWLSGHALGQALGERLAGP